MTLLLYSATLASWVKKPVARKLVSVLVKVLPTTLTLPSTTSPSWARTRPDSSSMRPRAETSLLAKSAFQSESGPLT